jgi:hypothetical protein
VKREIHCKDLRCLTKFTERFAEGLRNTPQLEGGLEGWGGFSAALPASPYVSALPFPIFAVQASSTSPMWLMWSTML